MYQSGKLRLMEVPNARNSVSFVHRISHMAAQDPRVGACHCFVLRS